MLWEYAGVRAVGEHCLDEAVVGEVVRRHVPLDAVHDVRIPVEARGRRQVADVAAGVLLGDRVALVPLAADGRPQPPLELLLGRHLRPPLRRGVQAPRHAVGDPPDLLLHQDLLQRREARAAQ